ncbi:MAG: hypothetical protein AABO41_09295 [Acidobacteriota bacterium]
MSEKNEGEETPSPYLLSEPGLQYSRDHNQLLRFADFVTNAASLAEERIALEETIRATSKKESPDLSVGAVDEHLRLLIQMMLCRSVDNFLTYVSELLALTFRTRPEMLKSNETARLDLILQFKRMDDLISFLVEKRVTDLAYKGMRDLSKDLSTKIGFNLFEGEEALARAVRIIEVRNLIVHNRAIVNRLFLSRLPDFTASLGDRVDLQGNAVLDDMEFLDSSVSDIDRRAVEKFVLPLSIAEGTA